MSLPDDFAFTPQDKAPDPDLGLARIPVDRYTDPAYLKLEDDRIWSKTWLLAGAVCDVSEPGDYFVFSNLRESVLVTRAADGVIRAFYKRVSAPGKSAKGAWMRPFRAAGLRLPRLAMEHGRNAAKHPRSP